MVRAEILSIGLIYLGLSTALPAPNPNPSSDTGLIVLSAPSKPAHCVNLSRLEVLQRSLLHRTRRSAAPWPENIDSEVEFLEPEELEYFPDSNITPCSNFRLVKRDIYLDNGIVIDEDGELCRPYEGDEYNEDDYDEDDVDLFVRSPEPSTKRKGPCMPWRRLERREPQQFTKRGRKSGGLRGRDGESEETDPEYDADAECMRYLLGDSRLRRRADGEESSQSPSCDIKVDGGALSEYQCPMAGQVPVAEGEEGSLPVPAETIRQALQQSGWCDTESPPNTVYSITTQGQGLSMAKETTGNIEIHYKCVKSNDGNLLTTLHEMMAIGTQEGSSATTPKVMCSVKV